MIKRIGELIYYFMMSAFVLVALGGPIYHHGVIGWFIGLGFIMSVIFAMALVESLINFIIHGEFTLKLAKQ